METLRKYFVTVFSRQEQFQTGKHFDKTMKNENETMENELIMMIYILFTIIKN